MSHKPLNLKEIKKLIEECARDYEIFGDARIDATFIDIRDHLKSAVQGLLEEIEERMQECREDKKRFEPKDCLWNSYDGELIGLEVAEELIKKWFADVINKEEER